MSDKGINVVAGFDGVSCGLEALKQLGIKVNKYYAFEICKSAIFVSNKNHPEVMQCGNILGWKNQDIPWEDIDLVIAGTPCQDFSIARVALKFDRKGLEGDKSSLFYVGCDMLDHVKKVNPKVKFLFENVKMDKTAESELNQYLGVKGVHINSINFSFQSRQRIYWCNWKIEDVVDREVSFQDHKDTDFDYCNQFKTNKTPSRIRMWNDGLGRTNTGSCNNITNAKKIGCVTVKQDRCPNSGLIEHGDFCRYLTTRELEKAQTLPEGYTEGLSYNQAQKVIGNGWNIETIKHIFKSGGLH